MNKVPTNVKASSGSKPDSAKPVDAPFRLSRWILGWVLIPCSVLLAIFIAGVHVGARNPDLWPLAVIRWLTQTFRSVFG